jgi:hypothetical protein
MKKLIAIALAMLSVVAIAQPHNHGHWRYNPGPTPWIWMAPTVIGGVIGYEIARQPPVIVQPSPPAYVTMPVSPLVCSPWTQVRNLDGTSTYTRTCNQ